MDNKRAMLTASQYLESTTPDPNTGCWPFKNKRGNKHGYVQVYQHRRKVLIHRLIWELVHGPIPPGLNVLHTCDNPPCINPDHLFLGTHADNVADMVAKNRHASGDRHARAKVNADQIRRIRDLASTLGRVEIAQRFGISVANVGFIVKRKTWKHIE